MHHATYCKKCRVNLGSKRSCWPNATDLSINTGNSIYKVFISGNPYIHPIVTCNSYHFQIDLFRPKTLPAEIGSNRGPSITLNLVYLQYVYSCISCNWYMVQLYLSRMVPRYSCRCRPSRLGNSTIILKQLFLRVTLK
jgi:hypothetical protein